MPSAMPNNWISTLLFKLEHSQEKPAHLDIRLLVEVHHHAPAKVSLGAFHLINDKTEPSNIYILTFTF